MNRRTFLKAAAVTPLGATAANLPTSFLGNEVQTDNPASGIAVRFLGTGAADWNGKDERGEHRRLSSILIEKHILMDFTPSASDMLPKGIRPDAIFYTHSHGDHYQPAAALSAGVRKIYLSHTWFDAAVSDFQQAAKQQNLAMPEIIPLFVGQRVRIGELSIMPVPANHATSNLREQTLLYLMEKGDARVLYATDTAGIPAVSAQLIGIDAHKSNGKPITGFIMEATMGLNHDADFRHFTHTDVSEVLRIVKVLTQTNRYLPPANQPVYLTHMARTLHGTQAELDVQLPSPLKAAYDGLEVVFK